MFYRRKVGKPTLKWMLDEENQSVKGWVGRQADK
jgi:hypothetical protein